MTQTGRGQTGKGQAGRGKTIALWILQILLAAGFITAGVPKVMGVPAMVAAYDLIGWGQWFRYLTGILEIAGAIGLLVPRTVFFAALGLAGIMVAAIIFCLAVLNQPAAPAIVFLLLAGALAYFRRP